MACSFSRSRRCRVRRVSIPPACEETGGEQPDSRRRRIRAFDAIRQPPDTLTRITRPPYGLPVRGWGTRDRRLPSTSTRPVHSDRRIRVGRLAADRPPFVQTRGRTGSVRAERTDITSLNPIARAAATASPGVSAGEGRRTLNPEVAGSIPAGATAGRLTVVR